MDDIMVLMNKVVLDILVSFDETQFGIFNESEQPELLDFWKTVDGDFKKFAGVLSPDQKLRVAAWASERTTYPTKDLIKALKKFTAYLESSSYKHHDVYPKHKQVQKQVQKHGKLNFWGGKDF